MLTYYVGTTYEGDTKQVLVCVKRTKEEAEGLQHLRLIVAPTPDAAACKYVELVSGGRVELRRLS